MPESPTQVPVLLTLRTQPSRASAAAIGNHYVLNGAPIPVQLMGLDALTEMVCDWSVDIIGETVDDACRSYEVRRHAVFKLRDLVLAAITHGYRGISRLDCRRLAKRARIELRSQVARGQFGKIPAVTDLCSHIERAIAQRIFSPLPDF